MKKLRPNMPIRTIAKASGASESQVKAVAKAITEALARA